VGFTEIVKSDYVTPHNKVAITAAGEQVSIAVRRGDSPIYSVVISRADWDDISETINRG